MTPRIPLVALLAVLFAVPVSSAQQQQSQPPPPAPPQQKPQQPQSQDHPPPKKADDASQESSSKKHYSEPEPEPEEKPGGKDSKYDPYPAHHDVEVGTYYMHKGDVDAAIERFKDAIERLPSFAKPRLLLGEAYEKKGDKSEAVKYYKEYLQVLPNAPDAKQVRKKIEKLSEQK